MTKKRLTILADPVDDADIVEYFKDKGVTETGLKLMRAALVLDEADLLDHITLLIKKGVSRDLGSLETIKKALEISALFEVKENPEPEPAPVKTSRKRLPIGGVSS